MEKFNEIKSRFETDFNAIKEETTEEPEYENIGAVSKKTVKLKPLKNKSSFTAKNPLKPPRTTPRQLQASSTNEYENIEYASQKPIERANSLTRAPGKKKIKKPRTKPLEILPIINEDFAKFRLASSEDPEYANIVPRNLLNEDFAKLSLAPSEAPEYTNIDIVPRNLSTEYFLPNNTSVQSNLSEKAFYPSQDFAQANYEQANYEYVINNSLYVDFFQRTGQSPTQDFSSEEPFITSKLQKEREPIKTNLSGKKPTPYSISNPFVSKKTKRENEKPTPALHPLKEDEPIFANITKFNPDGTIDWETWKPDENAPIQSNMQSKSKLSKLSKNLNFWSKPSKKNQEILEETNVLEVKKPFSSL